MSPRKANTPVLTRERIVQAAIALVDRDGLAALSMRKLAAELAVGPMTLYHHVPDRSALEDLIFDAVMSEVDFSDDDPTLDAGQRAVRLGWSIRTALLTHPNTVPITLSRSARTPTQLRPVEMMLGVLYDIGLNPTDAIAAVDIIGQYVFGTTLAYVNHLAQEEQATQAPQTGDEAGIPPEEFPNLMHAISESDYLGWDTMFDRGLHALVHGLIVEKVEVAVQPHNPKHGPT